MRRQRIRKTILVISFLLFPVTLNYFSPYLMTQGTFERVATMSLLVWGAIFATSLVAGRSFCGWICPFHGLQMFWEKAADKPLKRIRHIGVVKYVLWAMWMTAVAAGAVAAGGWSRFDPLYMTPLGVSVDSAASLITYYALVGITLAPLALGRRGFCHYLCPFGVFGVIGTRAGRLLRLPAMGLHAEPSSCDSCGRCTKECPMSLPVSDMVQRGHMRTTECILCAGCADTCPKGAIKLELGRGHTA